MFLNSFPNPERKGCPDSETIKAVAAGKLSGEDENRWIDHFTSCSPCTREFAAFRREFKRRQRIKVLATAAVIAIIFFASWFVMKNRRSTVGTYTAVVLDLRNRMVLRSVPEAGEQAQQPLMLLRGIDNVSLYLPTGSRTGTYDVAVFQKPGMPLVTVAGTATTGGSLTVLKARLDVSKLNSGHYLLGIRPPGVDWSYYPLVLR